MTFFIDNNLSRQLADGMKGFGEDVMHLQEKFPQDASDVEWLQYVGENNHLLVTRDLRILYNPVEKDAMKKYQVGAFFMAGKNKDRCELIRQLVRNWHHMKKLAHKKKRPFAYQLREKGIPIKLDL